MLAVSAEPGVVRLITVDTGALIANLESPGASVIWHLRFSRDGSQLFALRSDRRAEDLEPA